MLFRPRETIRSLPSDRFFATSLIVSVCLSWLWADQLDLFQRLQAADDAWPLPVLFLMFLLAAAAGFFVVSFVLAGLVRLLGVKQSARRVMNLVGYSHVPRLAFTASVSFIFIFFRNSGTELSTPDGIAPKIIAVTGALVMLYSLILLTMGLTAVPEEPQPGKKERK
jgi:amino acid transporter